MPQHCSGVQKTHRSLHVAAHFALSNSRALATMGIAAEFGDQASVGDVYSFVSYRKEVVVQRETE